MCCVQQSRCRRGRAAGEYQSNWINRIHFWMSNVLQQTLFTFVAAHWSLSGCHNTVFLISLVTSVFSTARVFSWWKEIKEIQNWSGTEHSLSCSLLQTPVTYCAADTSDLERVVQHVRGLYPDAPVLGAGVSLGGWVDQQLSILGKLVLPSHGFLLSCRAACYCWATWPVRARSRAWWRVWPSRSPLMLRSPQSRWKNHWIGFSLTNTSLVACVVPWSGRKIWSLWNSGLRLADDKPT